MKRLIVALLLALLISSPTLAGEKYRRYTKDFQLKDYLVKQGDKYRIYSKDWQLQGYIEKDRVYNKDWVLQKRLEKNGKPTSIR